MGYYQDIEIKAGPVRIRAQMHNGRIEHLWLPFTPVQWVDVANKESRWLSACCGDISAVRDTLISALCEGGQIWAAELRDLVATLAAHDGFEELSVTTPQAWVTAAARWAEHDPDNPFLALGHIWFAVRDELATPVEPKHHELDPRAPEDALQILATESAALSWALCIRDEGPLKLCQEAERTLSVARLLGALPTLVTRLHELAPPCFEGLAVIETATGKLWGRSANVFATALQVLHVFASGNPKREAKFRAEAEVRRCRVSLAEGVVLGDMVPWEQIDREATAQHEEATRERLAQRAVEARAAGAPEPVIERVTTVHEPGS